MTFNKDFWIICQFIVLMDVTHCQTIQSRINDLASQLENAFNNLNNILRPSDLIANLSNFNVNLINATVATNILSNSKAASENIVFKTDSTVNNLQSVLTTSYQQYNTPPRNSFTTYCSNTSFIPYYRAKSIRNSPYPNLKYCDVQALPFTQDPLLDNVLTNRYNSTAHVPTNIYDSSIELQNVANWTNLIDQNFILKQTDPRLKWQYFCSNYGWFKIYPGIQWYIQATDWYSNNSNVDWFDCRSEIFYLQSTSYPKRMIIMVDNSGSMSGISTLITNQTVYEILNTLTENDYFNIVLFGSVCSFADNVTKNLLIKSTDINKAYMYSMFQKVFNPNGVADFQTCQTNVFNLLRNDKINQTASIPYNYFVSIVTDGSFNYSNNFINNDIGARIFTYLTVQGAPEHQTVATIPCSNNGFANEGTTLEGVKETVQSYLNVIARKTAIMQNAFNIWTGIHSNFIQTLQVVPKTNTTGINVSITTPSTYQGITIMYYSNVTTVMQNVIGNTSISIIQETPIKLFVTASKAVYDQSFQTIQMNNGILLGTVGIDVSPNEFIKTAPFWKIGVNAYLFGITSNGFLVFHPKFRPQYKNTMKYYYKNVDITMVELESNITINTIGNNQIVNSRSPIQFRNTMLNQTNKGILNNSIYMKTFQIVDNFKTGFEIYRNYYITGISGTSYIFGLAIPDNQSVPIYSYQNYVAINTITFKNSFQIDFNTLNNQCAIMYFGQGQGGMTLKNYEFCYMSPDISKLQLNSSLCALINVLTNTTLLSQCLTDTTNTTNNTNTMTYLNNIYIEITNTTYYPVFWAGLNGIFYFVQQVFSMHHFGLIRYYNYEALNHKYFIVNHSLGIEDTIYQETILTAIYFNNNNILVVKSLPNEVFLSNILLSTLVIIVTRPLSINGSYLGIVGVQARFDYFQSILMGSPLCGYMPGVKCFIITESATILANNKNLSYNGNSLTNVDCALMESLVNNSIFNTKYFYDFQGLCNINQSSQTNNYGPRLINPFSYLINIFVWMISQIFLFIQNFSITSLMWYLSGSEENPPYDVSSVNNGRPCYLKLPVTIAQPLASQMNGNINCTGCNISWFIRPIQNTNLMLIISMRSSADCSCNCSSNFGKTIELTRNSSNPISNPYLVNPNYYSSFVPFTKTENSSICSNKKIISCLPKLWLIWTLIFSSSWLIHQN